MQIKIFTLPLVSNEVQMEEMNHFLRANKIVDIRKDLAVMDGNSCWTFCVTYLQNSNGSSLTGKSNKVDYKEVLDEESFKRFSELRKARKTIADSEAVPAYAIFTDAELAEISKLPQISPTDMLAIPGIGAKKVEKYANILMETLTTLMNETSGISN